MSPLRGSSKISPRSWNLSLLKEEGWQGPTIPAYSSVILLYFWCHTYFLNTQLKGVNKILIVIPESYIAFTCLFHCQCQSHDDIFYIFYSINISSIRFTMLLATRDPASLGKLKNRNKVEFIISPPGCQTLKKTYGYLYMPNYLMYDLQK